MSRVQRRDDMFTQERRDQYNVYELQRHVHALRAYNAILAQKAFFGISGSGESGDIGAAQDILDVNGNLLTFTVSPSRDCWWDVRLRVLLRNTAAAWHRIDPAIMLTQGSPASGPSYYRTVLAGHVEQSWQTATVDAMFPLDAGTTYTVKPTFLTLTGGPWRMWLGTDYSSFEHLGVRPR